MATTYDLSHIPELRDLQKLAQKQNAKTEAINQKLAAMTIPTKTSQLTNDSGFQTSTQVNTAIQTAISKSGHASYKKVASVPAVADAAENILYLVYNSKTKHYDIYAKILGSDGKTYTMEQLDDTTVDLSNYVQKVDGKGLSTNDYTTAEKTKLAGIAEGANKYEHPTHTAYTSGLYKVTVDALGHVTAATNATKADITGLGIPAQDTTYSAATASKAGLLSAADKTKLDSLVLATDTEVDAMLTEIYGD